MAQREATRLAQIAARLQAQRGGEAAGGLYAFTDPARSGDVLALAARLPRSATLVYRHFGAADRLDTARRLRRITWRRGVALLIGADPALARAVRADGVHLPERAMGAARWLKRMDWRITCAAHSGPVARRAASLGVDAVVVSAVFPSRSASASLPIGPLRLARIARAVLAPVIALGGVNGRTAGRLIGTDVAGLAAVEALAP